MRIPKLAKDLLTYIPVLAVLAAVGIGLFLGNGLYPASLNSQSQTPAQVLAEPKDLQLLPGPGADGPCFYGAIYTSLPPKCRTADGKFIPLPRSSYFLVIPPGK
jgi:hypothetical protein